MRALKELESNFVRTEQKDSDTIVRFHNPSVRDFIESRLAMSSPEVMELCESAVFFEQFVTLWNIGSLQAKTDAPYEGAPTIPSNISRQPDMFFKGILRTFESGDYNYRVEHRPEEGVTVTYGRRHMPLESRIAFALLSAEVIYGQGVFVEAGPILRPMFDRLVKVLESNTGDKGALLALLHGLQENRLQRGLDSGVIPTNLFTVAKSFLMQRLHSP
jgi:hypothetical protein